MADVTAKYNNYPDDPYTFIKTEEFFRDKGTFEHPFRVEEVLPSDGSFDDLVETGAVFRLNDKTLLLIQFIRPKVWRIRYQSTKTSPEQYGDFNSRTIICDTLTKLRATLDQYENIFWGTVLTETDKYYCIQSVQYPSQADKDSGKNGKTVVRLFVEKNPFKMVAVRSLEFVNNPDLHEVLGIPGSETTPAHQRTDKIVWETVERPLRWKVIGETTATILTVKKPGSARYLGFGEQGGKGLFKKSTLMTYFNYDNMLYSGVYGKGPLDEREPLYHSEPFWVEANTHQGMNSKVATFVDNYSEICIDFGDTNAGKIRTGTRFGALQYYVIAGDDIPDVIQMYTSLIGRPRLKPRFILGHHQGCYGYETQQIVLDKSHLYRDRNFPIDGVHIDVDLQDEYRTFTTSPKAFPDAKWMFSELRKMGIKCSTNITPVIKNADTADKTYTTYSEGLEKGYFVKDYRKRDDINASPNQVRYMCYEGGVKKTLDPSVWVPGANPEDNWIGGYPDKKYLLENTYDQGVEYHGGVAYGSDYGTPGFYPDLNRLEVRQWWGRQYRDLFAKGLEFVWQDMTTPCINPAYGDAKGFPFRLLISSDAWKQDTTEVQHKTAIEIWNLYSYNLHKATYIGLNRLGDEFEELAHRKGRRNFIIGRGSFAGMHRYAGLWTGDNGSTWEHFQISVFQVLAAGLSGVSITGADVGGFMPNGNEHYADPELLIRWYGAYFLLPWFRNHYHGKVGMKWFQEPFVYTDHFNSHKEELAQLAWLYLSVEPVCRYYTELRYTLLQLLYDAMFENMLTGLPIARPLVVTDVLDEALFGEAADFVSSEYMVRRDLLVCPLMESRFVNGNDGTREVYLPQPNGWFVFNLRTLQNGYLGKPLQKRLSGGSTFVWDASISSDPEHIPYITPMFVREGGIIPQIELRQYIPDYTDETKNEPANPITIHVYPGRSNSYTMYLDDGVSRESAPKGLLGDYAKGTQSGAYGLADPYANDVYREVQIKQDWGPTQKYNETTGKRKSGSRTVTIATGNDGFSKEKIRKCIGDNYKVVLWHDPQVDQSSVELALSAGLSYTVDSGAHATVVTVPVETANEEGGVSIDCTFNYLV